MDNDIDPMPHHIVKALLLSTIAARHFLRANFSRGSCQEAQQNRYIEISNMIGLPYFLRRKTLESDFETALISPMWQKFATSWQQKVACEKDKPEALAHVFNVAGAVAKVAQDNNFHLLQKYILYTLSYAAGLAAHPSAKKDRQEKEADPVRRAYLQAMRTTFVGAGSDVRTASIEIVKQVMRNSYGNNWDPDFTLKTIRVITTPPSA